MSKFYLISLLIGVFVVTTLSASCGGRRPRIFPNAQFSVNVAPVPLDWPDEEKDWPENVDAALRMQRVYERHGPPDFFRIRWTRDGRILTQRELSQMQWTANQRSFQRFMNQMQLEHEWVYLDERKLFRFHRNRVEETELPDTIRIICEYGDPNDISQTRDVVGPVTTYTYFQLGTRFYFRDGKLDRREEFTAMTGWGERR